MLRGGVFYIKGKPFEEGGDFIPLALVSGAILVSPSKNPLWDSHLLRVGKFIDGERDEEFTLYNIASCEHGECLNDIFRIKCRVSVKDSFPACHFSSGFVDWCNGLSDGNRLRVVDRIRMAESLGFVGSPPLLKRLVNAEGLWEIRAFAVTSAGDRPDRSRTGGAQTILSECHQGCPRQVATDDARPGHDGHGGRDYVGWRGSRA